MHDVAATRRAEAALAARRPAHDLMQRAGRAVARLALAVAPHQRCTWVACGPGNNGGDGFEAAMCLQQSGHRVVASFAADPDRLPPDAATAYRRAREAGVPVQGTPPADWDLCIDAMLGIGSARPLEGHLLAWQQAMERAGRPVLAVDLPSGLDANTGQGQSVTATHTLSLLTLKPGLFTGRGRDAAGTLWLDTLGAAPDAPSCSAWLNARGNPVLRPHASHKGSFGDVAVIGGARGMGGAALLAARAALHGGAGRVFVGLLDASAAALDPGQPELMLRPAEALDLAGMSVACGCGGGPAVADHLPRVLATARALVLDADALNAMAADPHLQALLRARGQRRGWSTVLTPHPLEAARLLGTSTDAVQADRVAAASQLASWQPGTVVVLKGSGTVIAAQGRLPVINPTGNARLATAGTGDVLAGLIAARLAGDPPAFDAACDAVYAHGAAADAWDGPAALTAGTLAARLG